MCCCCFAERDKDKNSHTITESEQNAVSEFFPYFKFNADSKQITFGVTTSGGKQ